MLISRDVYLNEVLDQIPRLIGLINRNPLSKTYGCFDRQYWHYNTTDFPCAELQESVLTLAYLYVLKHENNPFYNQSSLIEWINAGIHFWCSIQNKNGSFSEWYPNENSMSVTPFSTYAISETLLLLEEKINNRELVIASLEKAGQWLIRNKDIRATNHFSGSTIAFYNLYKITHNPIYSDTANRIISELNHLQDEEGWFPEYNGADIGYTSVTLYYLSQYYKKANDDRILKMISGAVDFTFYFVHPDGTFGGEYGSRNTEYIIPDGFEILAPYLPKAALIACWIRKSLSEKKHVIPACYDDRYLSYLSYMYIQAYADATDNTVSDQHFPFEKEFIKEFPNSGLKIISTPWCYCVQNIRKGGALKIDFKKSNRSFVDAGILVKDKRMKNYYSFYLGACNSVDSTGLHLKLQRHLSRIPDNILTPSKNILQRIFNISIGKVAWIEKLFKDLLRNILITNTKPCRFIHTREIRIDEDGITISDMINNVHEIDTLIVGAKSSYIYGPSTRFFQPSELNQVSYCYNGDVLERFSDRSSINIVRNFDPGGLLVSTDISSPLSF